MLSACCLAQGFVCGREELRDDSFRFRFGVKFCLHVFGEAGVREEGGGCKPFPWVILYAGLTRVLLDYGLNENLIFSQM